MIIDKNRELLIPNNERYIGTTYDTETENRIFQVPRYSQRGVDLAALTFRLDIQYANESYDTIVLDKEIGEAFVILIWRITSSTLQVPGTMYIGLRAVDNEATVKWSSFSAAMYVERHLNTPGNYGGGLTEIEQMEQDHQYMKGVVNELKANLDYAHDAEAWAQGTRNGTAVPSTDKTYHKNSKYYSEQANASKNAAANSATAAAESATQAADTVEDTNTRFNNAMAAVTSDTEVIDARVGADGTQYTVLKNRLDAEHSLLKRALEANTDQIIAYNAADVLPSGQEGTSRGVTYTWDGKTCVYSGTASVAASVNKLIDSPNALPPGFVPGDTYELHYTATTTLSVDHMELHIAFYKNGTQVSNVGYNADATIDIPSDTTGVVVQLQVAIGDQVNGSCTPILLNKAVMTNKELTRDVTELNELKKLSEITRNLFTLDDVRLGIATSGVPSTGSKQSTLTPDILIGNEGMVVTGFSVPNTIKYRVYVHEPGYSVNNVKKWIDTADVTGPHSSVISGDYAGDYVGIRFENRSNTAMSWSDFDGLKLQIEKGTQSTLYIPHESSIDNEARQTAVSQTKLNVCSYNLGHFAHGVGVVPENEQGAISSMKTFLNDKNFDIIGLQENVTTLPSTATSNDVIYNPLFPDFIDVNNSVCCKSKYTLIQKGSAKFSTGRDYVYANAIINGKTVFVMSVHLSTTSKANRLTEYAELFDILDTHNYYIVFGDFNAGVNSSDGEQSEFDVLIAHGCHVANGGYMGLLYTARNAEGTTQRCLDNIVTSPNIIIGKTYVPDVYSSMYSDHMPLIAELFVN